MTVYQEQLLEQCKLQVAEKFHHKSYEEWVNQDYLNLSDDILEVTQQYLSVSTLKRVFGKISTEASPKQITLDILAQYIGNSDWNDFAKKNPTSIQEEDFEKPSKEYKSSGKKIFILVFAGLLVLTTFSVLFYIKTEADYSDVKLECVSKSTKAPYTAKFKVTIPENFDKPCYVNFSDAFESNAAFKKYKINKDTRYITHTYMVPGVFHPHLVVDGKKYSKISVPVFSSGWEWNVVNYNYEPFVFHAIPDKDEFRKDGVLEIPSKEVVKYNVDTITGYCMRYLNYQKHPNYEGELHSEMKVRNLVKEHLKCSNIELQLKFQNGNVGMMLYHNGCKGNFARVQLGDTVIQGIENDLSFLEVDLDQWQKVQVELNQKSATFKINDKIVYQNNIKGSLGDFYGVSLNTQPSAQIDYITIKSKNKVFINEQFNAE